MYLSVLPLGKIKTYKNRLVAILRKIQADNPSFEHLVKWAKQEFVDRDWIKESLRMITFHLSLAEEKDGQLFLTKDGRLFLESQHSRVILDRMLENIWGIKEMLAWLQDRSCTLEELREKFCSEGAKWKSTSQVLYRVNWLRVLGYVDKIGAGNYTLSEKGKEALRLTKQ